MCFSMACTGDCNNIAERIDDQYGKSHFGGKKSDYDVIKIEESAAIT